MKFDHLSNLVERFGSPWYEQAGGVGAAGASERESFTQAIPPSFVVEHEEWRSAKRRVSEEISDLVAELVPVLYQSHTVSRRNIGENLRESSGTHDRKVQVEEYDSCEYLNKKKKIEEAKKVCLQRLNK